MDVGDRIQTCHQYISSPVAVTNIDQPSANHRFIKYLVPTSVDQQEEIARLNSKVFDGEILVPWDTIKTEEQNRMTNRCGTSDIDFIFLLDTSGSVGYVNWETTTTFIGKLN